MDQLLAKAKINDSQLKSLLTRAVAKNLSSLSEPCYYPEVKKNYYEFLKLTGLTEKDVKEFTKRRWAGRKEAKFAIHSDPIANFYVFLMQYFLKKNDKRMYINTMIFFIIRYYANLMHKSFKYCNEDVFKYALEILTKTHLFAREKTISNALMHIATSMVRGWTKGIKSGNLDDISRFMQDSRTRVSQSMKSFAQTYYRASEEGAGIQSEPEPREDDEEAVYQIKAQEKGAKLADEMTKRITVYRFTDRKSQEESRRLAKINSSLATQIVSKLNNTKHSDNLRVIYRLYMKDLPDAKSLCGSKYESYVRQLMSIKRTRMKIYFKQQVNLLLLNLLDEIDYRKKYDKLTSQTQFLINLYLAYYLTMILKNTLC
jgi:hypothetical protein